MRTLLLSVIIQLILFTQLFAGEGMWLPFLLGQLNESEMQSMGMKMSAEDIYSINEGSLKDAIVHFGGFCTGEVISASGLVLTNHHCGYDAIQKHSNLENNYLKDGFWAADHSKELSNDDLFVTFIVRIDDVTKQVLQHVKEGIPAKERQSLIDKQLRVLKAEYPRHKYQDVIIKPFFHGNQYFIFTTETYNDVRLVGAPPSDIGKFGADTDNWEFPRHTGDFSLFRIYTGPDGKPAAPSKNNIPMLSRHHLPISLDGVAVNDFTLVFGFPGRTDEYLPAVAVDQRINLINPIRISLRDRSLEILDYAMRKNPESRLQYASKQARLANGWKKWKGENQGIKATGAIQQKKILEAEFEEIIAQQPKLMARYDQILSRFNSLYKQIGPYAKSREFVYEIIYRNVETFRLAATLSRVVKSYESGDMEAVKEKLSKLKTKLTAFYKDYNAEIDQTIAASLLTLYYRDVTPAHQSPYAKDQLEFAGGNVGIMTATLFEKSFLSKGELVLKILSENPEGFIKQLQGDFLFQFVKEILDHNKTAVLEAYNKYSQEINTTQRQYMAGLMVAFPDRRFYPDANGTMRVTYGKVEGYSVGDSLTYDFSTYLDGLVDKYIPGDYEFDVPAKLLKLHKKKDYGQYAADNGKMPVCFLGSNHTTGGNSGSPVIDAHGNLVGLNFDRTWHGTMSDINYDADICRNIMVDARYILFIIDKFADAGHLVEEMTLVHPKK